MSNRFARMASLLAVAFSLVLASCGSGDGEPATTEVTTTIPGNTTTTTTPATTTSATPATTTTVPTAGSGVVVYFMLDALDSDAGGPFLVPVFRSSSSDSALDVMELLLDGPTAAEMEGTPSISTAIPLESEVLGIEIAGGTATVDLSNEFEEGSGSAAIMARLAQVVFTLTRMPGVERVVFEIEGEPVSVFSSEGLELDGPQQRADFYDQLPAIFIDTPAWGEPVTSPVHVSGLSNVFEAVSQVMLTDNDGLTLFEATVMATCGTGCWGEWEQEVTYTMDRDQLGSLIVWEYSAKDGSRVNVLEYPVALR